MAPDKIYIQQDMINNLILEKQEFDDDVEYIRKDALLEWLEKRLHEVGLAGTIHIIDVIDKLNSM